MIYRYENPASHIEAGHVRLFDRRMGHGWYLLTWHRISAEYPLHRCWNLGLLAVHHVSTDAPKRYGKPGWSIQFARIECKRIHGGFSISLRRPDRYTPPKALGR